MSISRQRPIAQLSHDQREALRRELTVSLRSGLAQIGYGPEEIDEAAKDALDDTLATSKTGEEWFRAAVTALGIPE